MERTKRKTVDDNQNNTADIFGSHNVERKLDEFNTYMESRVKRGMQRGNLFDKFEQMDKIHSYERASVAEDNKREEAMEDHDPHVMKGSLRRISACHNLSNGFYSED